MPPPDFHEICKANMELLRKHCESQIRMEEQFKAMCADIAELRRQNHDLQTSLNDMRDQMHASDITIAGLDVKVKTTASAVSLFVGTVVSVFTFIITKYISK